MQITLPPALNIPLLTSHAKNKPESGEERNHCLQIPSIHPFIPWIQQH